MKRLIVIVLILLFLYIPNIIFAHSGRTDSNGGHWNHFNGTYHFHSGPHYKNIPIAIRIIAITIYLSIWTFIVLCWTWVDKWVGKREVKKTLKYPELY